LKRDRSLAPDGLLKPGIKLIGGKQGQKKDSARSLVYKLEPENTISYVEPFLGSASCLIGKRKHNIELVGDINRYIINFFQTFQLNKESLWGHIQDLLKDMSEEKWKRIRDDSDYYNDNSCRECTAAWFYIINKFSNNGIFRTNKSGKCNSSFCKTVKGRGIYDSDWFNKVYERIKDVKFYNTEFQQLLEESESKLDPKTNWIFLDPPYFLKDKDNLDGSVTIYNGKKFTKSDHERLCWILKNIKSRWCMTINDSLWVRRNYEQFNLLENNVYYSCSNTKKGRGEKKELIVLNYDPPHKGMGSNSDT
jgi:DNA adenine methylase